MPAFKQDGVAFQFCPVTPPGCGSGDLDGGMGFVGPFHVNLADMPIDKKIRREPIFLLTTLEKIKQNAVLMLVYCQEEDNFNGCEAKCLRRSLTFCKRELFTA